MKPVIALGLYLLVSFFIIALSLFGIIPTNYLGGIVVAAFIVGLFFGWLNAWHQAAKLAQADLPSNLNVKSKSPNQSLQNYPCLKEIIEGTKQGDVCTFSADCERVAVCISSPQTQ